MNILNIIDKKAQGKALNKDEIKFWVDGFTNGELPDYQISSLLMAIRINGMDADETYELTKAYIESGSVVDFGDTFVVDKHSTGGIGDKTSLILSPLMQSLGLNVGKLSGRGLGFTGGTVDKLESIEGFSTDIPKEQFIKNVQENGIALIGQIANLTPADKVIYALRDVTSTVQSMPLIAASIMSKKLANGADIIMLDVKCGAGAFMKTVEEAEKLSKIMIDLATKFGRKAVCVITNMDEPLGEQVGNANEVQEAIDTLKGNGPEDITELCIFFASFALAEKEGISQDEAKARVEENLKNGKAFDAFLKWVKLQNGKTDKLENETIFNPENTFEIKAEKDGYVNIKDSSEVGMIGVLLGGGRVKKTDKLDYQVGVKMLKKQGKKVSKGDVIAEVFYGPKTNIDEIVKYFWDNAVEVSVDKIIEPPLIIKVVK